MLRVQKWKGSTIFFLDTVTSAVECYHIMGVAVISDVAVGVCQHLKVEVKCLSRGVDSTGSEADLGKYLAIFPRAPCFTLVP